MSRSALQRPPTAERPQAPGPRAVRHREPILWLMRSGAGSRRGGFTLVELLIAVVIITASIGALALLSARQWSSSKDLNVMDRLENTVALDLGWLKTFGRYWRMSVGPYNLCPTGFNYATNANTCTSPNTPLSGATSYTLSTTNIDYEPDPNNNTCPNPTSSPVIADDVLARTFLAAARDSTITPIWQFPPIGSGTITASSVTTVLINSASDTGRPQLPSQTTLERTITFGKNLLYITYSFTGSNAAPYGFVRKVAVHPEAAAYCP